MASDDCSLSQVDCVLFLISRKQRKTLKISCSYSKFGGENIASIDDRVSGQSQLPPKGKASSSMHPLQAHREYFAMAVSFFDKAAPQLLQAHISNSFFNKVMGYTDKPFTMSDVYSALLKIDVEPSKAILVNLKDYFTIGKYSPRKEAFIRLLKDASPKRIEEILKNAQDNSPSKRQKQLSGGLQFDVKELQRLYEQIPQINFSFKHILSFSYAAELSGLTEDHLLRLMDKQGVPSSPANGSSKKTVNAEKLIPVMYKVGLVASFVAPLVHNYLSHHPTAYSPKK